MKLIISIISLISFVSTANAQTTFKTLTAADFDSKATATKNKIILDVRTLEEYQEGHLPNAVQIDFRGSDFKDQVNRLDKTKPVFVYCKGGGRSASSCETLKDLGFKEVYNLQGGITDWKKAGKIIVE
jgi:rhodanese-related sulfurtransferase